MANVSVIVVLGSCGSTMVKSCVTSLYHKSKLLVSMRIIWLASPCLKIQCVASIHVTSISVVISYVNWFFKVFFDSSLFALTL